MSESEDEKLATGGTISTPIICGQDQGEERVYPSLESAPLARGGWLPPFGHGGLDMTSRLVYVGDVPGQQVAGDLPDPRWLGHVPVAIAPPLTAEQVRAIVREEVYKALHPSEGE